MEGVEDDVWSPPPLNAVSHLSHNWYGTEKEGPIGTRVLCMSLSPG